MLLRICLILTILAGAGVIAVSHFKVRPHVQEIIDQREKNAKDRDTEKGLKTKALAELKATKSQLEAETKRANGLKQDLAKTREEYNESQQKLARWDGLGLDPIQVKEVIASEKNLRAANQALDEEKKFFAKKYKDTKTELDQLRNPDEDPPMPAGLKGRVLIVDPKWSFVVIDVGVKHGAVKNGVLMISRKTKLVAKVRIMSLQPDKSIANILPGWNLAEVMEGDGVIY